MSQLTLINILETDEIIRERVRQWRNKEEIRRSMFSQGVISRDEHARWLAGLIHRVDTKFWVVFLEGIPIGAAYVHHMEPERRRTQWGFYIGEETYKAKGLGQQILFDLLEEVFDRMAFEVLVTEVLSDNTRAIGIYRKFDFSEQKSYRTKDQREVIVFEFTRPVWEKTKERLRMMCQARLAKYVQ